MPKQPEEAFLPVLVSSVDHILLQRQEVEKINMLLLTSNCGLAMNNLLFVSSFSVRSRKAFKQMLQFETACLLYNLSIFSSEKIVLLYKYS